MPTALGKGCVPLEEFYSVLYPIYLSGGERLRALKLSASWAQCFIWVLRQQELEDFPKFSSDSRDGTSSTGTAAQQQHHCESKGSLGLQSIQTKRVSLSAHQIQPRKNQDLIPSCMQSADIEFLKIILPAVLQNHRITECFGLEGTIKIIHFHPLPRDTSHHHPRCPQAPSKLALKLLIQKK